MLLYALSFLAGISQLLWIPEVDLQWLFVSLFFIVVIRYYKKPHQLTSFVITFFFGFSYALLIASYHKGHQLQALPSKIVSIKGHVIGLPSISVDKTKFLLAVEQVDQQLPIKKIQLNWYETEQIIEPGQVWQFSLKLKPIHALYNPATFDYSRWLFRHGIDATGTIKQGQLLDEVSNDFLSKLNKLRLKIAGIITENINSQRVAALLTALMIGDKSLISYQDSQLFQTTGTAHLIAISGLHIGLMAFIGLLMGRLLFALLAVQTTNRFVFEAVFSIAFALIYALLAGMSIPTIRALVMVIVFALSYAFKSQVSRWQAWSLALLVVLVIDPLSVLDAGFWFSFSAVAVLMFTFSGKPFQQNKIFGFIQAQFVILLGLMPLMVIVFHQFNVLTPLANFLVLPLASLVLIPLLFLALFTVFLSADLAHYIFVVVEQVARLIFFLLDYLSQFSYLKIALPSYNHYTIVVFVIMVIIMLLPRLFRWKWVVLVFALPLFFKADNGIEKGEFKLNVLDVGQGLSIIIRTKNHTLVYDTGAKYDSGFSMVQAVVIPVLQSFGIKQLDRLILSHADNDHSGGASELIEKYNPQVFDVVGQHKNCQYPLSWKWDGVSFDVLSPFEVLPYMGNNTACVIKVSNINHSVLLPADSQEAVEYRLMTQFPAKIASDVLIVPHHGSKSSSTLDFIKIVNPKYAINSSGFANQFHHPHVSIVERYRENGIEFYDTQFSGMVEVYAREETIQIKPFINSNRHFWYSEFN